MIIVTAKRLLPLALVALLIPACDPFPGFNLLGVPVTVTAVLRGSQDVPGTGSAAMGTASFTINETETSITYTVTHSAASPTAVEIHMGAPGVNGPLVLSLGALAPATTVGTLTAVDFTPAPSVGILTITDACAAMLNGSTYLIVDTTGIPSGEIRGQIGPVQLKSANILGSHGNPAVVTTASASATFQLDDSQSQILVSLTSSGLNLTDVTGVFIHVGSPFAVSAVGNTIFTLFSAGTFTNPFSVTATVAEFTPQPPGIATFADAINALLSGLTYIEVVTGTHPTGEIRGQIGAMRLKTTTFNGTQETTPPTGTGSGSGSIALSGSQDSLTYTVTYTGLFAPGTLTSAHVHVAPVMLNGPVLFTLSTASAPATAGTLTGLLAAADIDAGSGLMNLSEVIEAMLAKNTYFEIRTTANPSGEIRGQILP